MNDAHAAQIATVQETNANEVAAAANAEGEQPTVKIKPKTLKRAAEKARDQADRDKRSALSTVESYTRYIREHMEKAEKAQEKADAKAALWAEAWTLLSSGGFRPEEDEWNRFRILVTTTEKKLPALAKLVGRLDMDNCQKEVEDAAKRIIRITANPIKYDFVRVSWTHKLTEDDACKIEEEVVPATVRHNLVCNREYK